MSPPCKTRAFCGVPKVRYMFCVTNRDITVPKEIAQLAREHNNANVICIPARYTSQAQAIQMVQVFLNTAFEGGRHERRVGKIALSC